jgi:hypothetical protein
VVALRAYSSDGSIMNAIITHLTRALLKLWKKKIKSVLAEIKVIKENAFK